MVKKLPCLYGYIGETGTGNRNENLFRAINHLTYYNQKATIEDIIEEALSINKAFETPLSEREVTTVCQHAIAKDYRTSCWKFKQYCKHCRYGQFRKLWRNSKKGYWKHINENNRLVGIKLLKDDTYYPWDIIDIDKVTPEQAIVIQLFREQMGIPIGIDRIVKSYGIPIGDKAKREWEKFKRG